MALSDVDIPAQEETSAPQMWAPTRSCHIALYRRQTDSNYGCNIILWELVFCSYCADTEVKQCGAGRGRALAIEEQFALAFDLSVRLKKL